MEFNEYDDFGHQVQVQVEVQVQVQVQVHVQVQVQVQVQLQVVLSRVKISYWPLKGRLKVKLRPLQAIAIRQL